MRLIEKFQRNFIYRFFIYGTKTVQSVSCRGTFGLLCFHLNSFMIVKKYVNDTLDLTFHIYTNNDLTVDITKINLVSNNFKHTFNTE